MKLDFEKADGKIHLCFLVEALQRKCLSQVWIDWIKQVLESYRFSYVKVNASVVFFCVKMSIY